MVTRLPHGLQKLLEVTVGMPWPEGSEEDLWDLAGAWETFAGELTVLGDGLLAEANNFAQVIQGATGDSIRSVLATDLHDGANQLKEQAEAYSKMLKNAGADIQKTKIMIIVMLGILAATIASLLASLFGSFAVPTVIAAARVGIGALLRSLLSRLMEVGLVNIARELAMKSFIGAVVGTGFMVGLDAAIQGVQIAEGHRKGMDTKSLQGSAIGGALGGALGGAAEGLAGVAAKLGRDIWRTMPRSVRAFGPLGSTFLQIPAAALSNPVINAATHSPGGAMDGIFGALDTGGGHAHAHVPGGTVKPLRALDVSGIRSISESGPKTVSLPVTSTKGVEIGTTFTPSPPATTVKSGQPASGAGRVPEKAALESTSRKTSGGAAGETTRRDTTSTARNERRVAEVGGTGAGGPAAKPATQNATADGRRAADQAGKAGRAGKSGEGSGERPASAAKGTQPPRLVTSAERAVDASADRGGQAPASAERGAGERTSTASTDRTEQASRAKGGESGSASRGEQTSVAKGGDGVPGKRPASENRGVGVSKVAVESGAGVSPSRAGQTSDAKGGAGDSGERAAEPVRRTAGGEQSRSGGSGVGLRANRGEHTSAAAGETGVPGGRSGESASPVADGRGAASAPAESGVRASAEGTPSRAGQPTAADGGIGERRGASPARSESGGTSRSVVGDQGAANRVAGDAPNAAGSGISPVANRVEHSAGAGVTPAGDGAGSRVAPGAPAESGVRVSESGTSSRAEHSAGAGATPAGGGEGSRVTPSAPAEGGVRALGTAASSRAEQSGGAGATPVERGASSRVAPGAPGESGVRASDSGMSSRVERSAGAMPVGDGASSRVASNGPAEGGVRASDTAASSRVERSAGAMPAGDGARSRVASTGPAESGVRASESGTSSRAEQPVAPRVSTGPAEHTATVARGERVATETGSRVPAAGVPTRGEPTVSVGSEGPGRTAERPATEAGKAAAIDVSSRRPVETTAAAHTSAGREISLSRFLGEAAPTPGERLLHTGGTETSARRAGPGESARPPLRGFEESGPAKVRTASEAFRGAGDGALVTARATGPFDAALKSSFGGERHLGGNSSLRMSSVDATVDLTRERTPAVERTTAPAPVDPNAGRLRLLGRAGRERVKFFADEVTFAPLERGGETVGMTFAGGMDRDRMRDWAAAPGSGERTAMVPAGYDSYQAGRQAGVVTERRAPWPDNVFFVNAHAGPERFAVTLADGREVAVSGGGLAHIAAQAPLFRNAISSRKPEAFVLLTCSTGAVTDGAGQAFQRTLAERFRYNRPVVAPTGSLDLIVGGDRIGLAAVMHGGAWRTFAGGPEPLLGKDGTGRLRYFRQQDIDGPKPLLDGDRLMGMTYQAEPRPTAELDHNARTFVVAADGDRISFGLTHVDGRKVTVDGETFAHLVSTSEVFRKAGRATDSLTLLADSTGALERQGGAAVDFQRALAATAGYDRPVFAPASAVTGDSRWNRFAPGTVQRSPSLPALDLVGLTANGRQRFSLAGVVTTPLRRDGRTIGVALTSGELGGFTARWAAQPATPNRTAVAGPGHVDYLAARAADAVTPRRAPWPDNAFFVAAHASPAGFEVELRNGTRVAVNGDVMAGILGQLPEFRRAVRDDRPEAFVLLACATGASDRPVAQRFQRTLAERFGGDFDRPVVAPSTAVQAVISPDVTTMVADGGTWRTFASGPTPVLAVDEANRAAYLRAGEVEGSPLFALGRLTGMSYLASGEGSLPTIKSAGRFFVVAAGRPDSFGVRTTDGRLLTTDGAGLARLVTASRPFRRYTEAAGTTPFVLLAESAGAANRPGGAAWDFRAALAAAEVHAPVSAVEVSRWRAFTPDATPVPLKESPLSSPSGGPAEARTFATDGPSAQWREQARAEAMAAAERMHKAADGAAQRMHEAAAGAAERLYGKSEKAVPTAETAPEVTPAKPEILAPAGPAERLHRARIERPKVEGDVDGAGLRGAIARLIGGKAVGGSNLRKLVDQAFSDENLSKDFERAIEGGMVADLGAGGKGRQIIIEAVALSSPREASTSTGSVSREHVVGPIRQRLHVVRTVNNTEPRAIRVPMPFVMFAAKLSGLVNVRGSELRSQTNREVKTKVSESDIESTTAQHDVTFRITVRKPGRYWWSKPVVQVAYHDVKAGLSWPEYPAVKETAKAEPLRPDSVEHTELSGLGQVYRAVAADRASAATDIETRRFREWLDRLPAKGRELLSGEPVRESFGFGGKAPVEVVVGVAAKDSERLADVTGSVTATRKFSAEHLATQSYTRRWGGSVTLGLGDFSHIVGGYAGFVGSTYRTTKTGTGRMDDYSHEFSRVYKGPMDKRRVELDYVVRVGDAPAITVPGTATVWTKPAETAKPAEAGPSGTRASDDSPAEAGPVGTPPSDDPAGADRFTVPDRVNARFRLPDAVVADIVGRVLHRLEATGLVKAKNLPRLNERFRVFLAEHAKEVVQGGDGVRFPLSAWQKGAPDIFVRGALEPEKASYLGVAEPETLEGKVTTGHTHIVEFTKGVDRSRGVVANVYKSKPAATAMNVQVTRERNQRDTGKSEQHLGAEKSLNSKEPVHRFDYPAEFEVRAGGRWSAPGEVLHWRDTGKAEGYPIAKIDGTVEVAAPKLTGDTFDAEAVRDDEPAGWHEDDVTRPEVRAGALPAGFALESLKPLPDLLTTATAMMGAPAETGWRAWTAKAKTGSTPPDVDQHESRPVFDREAGEQNERNVALDELENFAKPTARIAQFERVALFQDTLRLKSYNHPGLVGSREVIARIDLSAQMGNPRLLARDEAHTFQQNGKARTNREAKAETGAGYKARVSLIEIAPLGKTLGTGAEFSVGVGHVHTDGIMKIDGSSATDRGDQVEPGYLVGFDATYEVRTSARRNWGDLLGIWHDGKTREGKKWIHLPDAVKMWVPAGEVHRIGELATSDVAKLTDAEAGLYRTEQAKSADPKAVAGRVEPAEPAGDVRAPGNVGRGAGKVELYRLEAGAELVRQVQQRVEAWADEYRAPVADPLDVAHKTMVKPADELPRTPFDPINDRLVYDVLGPMLTGAVADSALREMLTGGRTVFLEGDTAFGKVEQLVVLRAELGEGRYHRTLDKVTRTVDLEATRTGGTIDQHRWGLDVGLNSMSSVTRDHRPGTRVVAGLNYMRRLTTITESMHEHKDTVTAEHSGAAVQFVHDLRVSMEVHPYARIGHYSKHLPGWFPTPGPRAVDAPWRSEFELPGAVRSTVPKEDTIPVDGELSKPVEEVTDSLRDWQKIEGRQPGLAAETVAQVRPFAAAGLHAALNKLISGADGRPALRPRAGYQLRSATESGPLRANVRELLSPEGYVIPVAGGAVSLVRIKADLIHRELVRVLDGDPLKLDLADKQTVKMISDLRGELGFSWSVDLRAVNAGTERGRPAIMVSDVTTPLVPFAAYNTTSVSTKPTQPKRKTDGEQRYLVRVTPVWEVEAAYRAKKGPADWAKPIRTGPDEPFLVEVNRHGLESLGLHDPGAPSPLELAPTVRRKAGNDLSDAMGGASFRRTHSRLRTEDNWPGWAFSKDFLASGRGLKDIFRRDVPKPLPPGPGGLTGLTDAGGIRSFNASDVQVHPLVKRGRTIGMTYLIGAERRYDVKWAQGLARKEQFTNYFAPGSTPQYQRGWGQDVRRARAPWPEDTFFISTHGDPDLVALRLTDGSRVRVLGETFARVTAAAEPFRAEVGADAKRPIALLVCYAGNQPRVGGVAHDFQRTLEAEFGHRQPVIAATQVAQMVVDPARLVARKPMAKVWQRISGAPALKASMTGVVEGGRWRTFAAGKAGLLGVEGADKWHYFTSSDVVSAEVTDGGSTVGVSFRTDVPVERPAYGAEVPWSRQSSFLVDVEQTGGDYRLALRDGRHLRVDGAALAKLVVQSAAFGSVDRPHSMVLLARTSAARLLGKSSDAPGDFRAALSDTFGFDGEVFAPKAVLPEPGHALNATGWHQVSRSEAEVPVLFDQAADRVGVRGIEPIEPIELSGLHEVAEKTLEPIRFLSSDVDFGVVHRADKPFGVSFGVGEDRDIDVTGLSQPVDQYRRTGLYPAGVWTGSAQTEVMPSPWADNAFFAVTHSNDRVVVLNLKDGKLVQVDGATYARMVTSVDAFRQAAADGAESVVLVSCAIAEGETSLAQDFQRTLEGEFGYRQPVVAPTGWVALGGDGHVGSYVADGGRWRTFTSPTSDLVVQDEGGALHALNPATVRAVPLRHRERVTVLNFRDADADWVDEGTPPGPWTDNTLFLDVSTEDGRFAVNASGDRKMLLEANQFARVVAESPSFREAMGRRPDSITLLASWSAAPVRDVVAAEQFQRTLAQEYGHDVPVLAPAAMVKPGRSGTDGPQVSLRGGGEFQFFPSGSRLSIGLDTARRSRFFVPGTVVGRRFEEDDVPVALSFVPGAETVHGSVPDGAFGLAVRTGPAGFVVTDADGHDLSLDGSAFAETLTRFEPFVEAMFHLDETSDRPLVEEWQSFALSGPDGGALTAPREMIETFRRSLTAALGRDIPLLTPETTAAGTSWRRFDAPARQISLKDFLTTGGP